MPASPSKDTTKIILFIFIFLLTRTSGCGGCKKVYGPYNRLDENIREVLE